MKQKKQTSLKNILKDKMQNIPLKQCLYVSLDMSHPMHQVTIFNGLQQMVAPPFEIDILRTNYEQINQAIDKVMAQTKALAVWVGDGSAWSLFRQA